MTNNNHKIWEQYPALLHLEDRALRLKMESRKRHKQVRYYLFRMQNQIAKKESVDLVDGLPPGFHDFWLGEKPEYMMQPQPGTDQLQRVEIPPKLVGVPVENLGGYTEFAKRWDVDPDLAVYLRWSSIWSEWNATLMRVVPILGED